MSKQPRKTTKPPGKTAAQRRVLDEIGCGNNSPIASDATIAALLRAGLIVECPPAFYGKPPFTVRVRQFEMTIPAHMQWCQHQAESVGGKG